MSKIIYAYVRHGANLELEGLKRRICAGAARIAPNSSAVRPARMVTEGRLAVGVLNPSSTILAEGDCIGVGHVAADSPWYQVGAEPPNGTYAICRTNGRVIELLSDTVGSRTLWYYIDASIFVASTSQRWITCVLGSFEANDNVLTWMLTTGTLGPAEGWDCRFSRLQPDSKLSVDLGSWTTTLKTRDTVFERVDRDACDHEAALRESLQGAFDSLEFDHSRWVLPLSGGYDSRAILCMLRKTDGLRTITWGTAASMRDSGSDAAIAARLAKAVGVTHEYFETDSAPGSLAEVFDKFVGFGEGRTDRISAYLDGFAIWQTLLARGIEGVIRGDEGFGWKAVRSFAEARRSAGLHLWTDFDGLPDIETVDLHPQELPDFLTQRNDETPSQWRDRLYHQFRIPTIMAALTDLKAPFVEIANPLLTSSIIDCIRTLPDVSRTEKALFKEIVDDLSPDIPYADSKSIADQGCVFRSGEASEILLDVVASEGARAILPKSLIAWVSRGMCTRPDVTRKSVALPAGAKRWVRRVVPRSIKDVVRQSTRKPIMDFYEMAFRIYIICKSHELLKLDACAGRAVDSP